MAVTSQKIGFALSGREMYRRGPGENVAYDEAREGLVLRDWAVVEDDADGCGHPFEKDIAAEGTWIRKVLTVDPAGAGECRLLIFHTVETLWESEPYEAGAAVVVNGHEYAATLRVGWNSIPIDPAHLAAGRNEITLGTPEGRRPAIIPIAGRGSILENAPWRHAEAQQSLKSTDGGKTWSTRLGERDDAAGEYMIRLRLRRHAASGWYISPVMDMADPAGSEVVKCPAEVRRLSLRIRQETPAQTAVLWLARTGRSPVLEAGAWEDWRTVSDGQVRSAYGRYLQIKLLLTTTDVLRSPVVRGVAIEAEVERLEARAAAPRVEEYRTFPVVRSGRPFEYEPLGHALLEELRQRYRLEDVVAGAATQFEAIAQLNHWVSRQWKWHPPVDYPEWNALEILEKGADGEARGGFCGQFAIVMVQCCLALGWQARFVFGAWPGVIAGHEVTEVWCDEHGKWVLMDPNMDRYYLDRQTGVPLNALELHRALLRHFFTDGGLGEPEQNKAALERGGFESYVERGPVVCHGGTEAGPDWFDGRRAHLMWGHVSLMPRNNFLSRPRLIPKQHGYGLPWSWNGYWHWRDAQTPPRDHFERHAQREADLYWNLNQVSLHLEQSAEAGVLRVTTETFTPDLEALLVSINGGSWERSEPCFLWRLRAGENRLEAKVRNVRGVEGRSSLARVTWLG